MSVLASFDRVRTVLWIMTAAALLGISVGLAAGDGDAGGGTSASANPADTTATRILAGTTAGPAVSILGTSNLGANQVTLSLGSSADGTGYFTLLGGTDTPCGTGSQVAAGQDSNGDVAARRGSLPLTANNAGTYSVRNLTQSTTYTLCFTADDGTTLQDTPVAAAFATTAATNYGTWGPVGHAGFTPDVAWSRGAFLACAPDGTPYVAVTDGSSGYRATVMRFDGTSWETVGNPGFSAGPVEYTTIAFAPDGTPYVANERGVMRLSGSSWVAVGSDDFHAGEYASLAFSPDGTPYVAYAGIEGKATVMRYTGGSWVMVGSGAVSAGMADWLSLAFAPDGSPYLVYSDRDNGNRATVMKFDGTGWVAVGGADIYPDRALYTSLALAPDGTPYVAFSDYARGERATVMKFSGGAWVTVGSPGFSTGFAMIRSLAIAPDGSPYVAFSDDGEGSRARVMRFDGDAWVTVGGSAVSADYAWFMALAFSPDGTPYVGYDDYSHAARLTVMRLLPASSISLIADPNPSALGTPVTLTATVSPPEATGTVTFMEGLASLGDAGLANGIAVLTTSALAAGDHSITAVYGGNAAFGASSSDPLVQTVSGPVAITIGTGPQGLQYSVDGSAFDASETFEWISGTAHAIGTTQSQSGPGWRGTFVDWSDGGAISHVIWVPPGPTSLVATFAMEYRLSTGVNPPGSGQVSPPGKRWYAGGTLVTVAALPKHGYVFSHWDGRVADPLAQVTTVTMNDRQDITAQFVESPVLVPSTTGKTGPLSARVWTLRLGNTGQSSAHSARIETLSLNLTHGRFCAPVIVSPLPLALGEIPVGDTATGTVTIDFSRCTAPVRFTATIGYSANGGAISGTKSFGNQYP